MSILRLDHLNKRFGGLLAVDRVSFAVEEGSVVGLIGPNGAGKTTVFNLITGNYKPDGGDVFFQEQSISAKPTHQIVGLGIARTFQTIRLFQNMTVLENVLAGCHCRMHTGLFGSLLHTPAQRREERQALRQSMVKAPSLFKAGAQVRVSAQGPGYAVTSAGQALSAGSVGQTVRVRMDNGRIVSGIVSEDGTVTITL